MRVKRGQLQISFGMIFSIILIIAVLAVSFYVIQYFVNLSTCSSIGLFHEALQEEIDTAWQGSSSRTLFDGSIPSSIDYVCFGNMTSVASGMDRERYDQLKRIYLRSDSNVFVYPQSRKCGNGINDHKLSHVAIEGFFCVKQDDGSIKVSLTKSNTETLVTLGSA